MPKKILTLTDVSPSRNTVPSPNSKNVIITNHPTIKDNTIKSDDLDKESSSLNHKINIQPINMINDKSPDVVPEEKKLVEKNEQPIVNETTGSISPDKPQYETINIAKDADTNINQDNQDKKKIDEQIALNNKQDELIDLKKYFLPINSVRNKKNKKFLILGVVLIIVLMLVWLDVSLDAGIFHIAGIKPVTNFFQQHP